MNDRGIITQDHPPKATHTNPSEAIDRDQQKHESDSRSARVLSMPFGRCDINPDDPDDGLLLKNLSRD